MFLTVMSPVYHANFKGAIAILTDEQDLHGQAGEAQLWYCVGY